MDTYKSKYWLSFVNWAILFLGFAIMLEQGILSSFLVLPIIGLLIYLECSSVSNDIYLYEDKIVVRNRFRSRVRHYPYETIDQIRIIMTKGGASIRIIGFEYHKQFRIVLLLRDQNKLRKTLNKKGVNAK